MKLFKKYIVIIFVMLFLSNLFSFIVSLTAPSLSKYFIEQLSLYTIFRWTFNAIMVFLLLLDREQFILNTKLFFVILFIVLIDMEIGILLMFLAHTMYNTYFTTHNKQPQE
jgi:hypothetical protein